MSVVQGMADLYVWDLESGTKLCTLKGASRPWIHTAPPLSASIPTLVGPL